MFENIKKKDIDLLKAYNRKAEPSKINKMMQYAVLPLCLIVLVLCLFAYGKFSAVAIDNEKQDVEKQIKKYEELIAKVGTEDYNQYLIVKSQNLKMEEIQEVIKSYPRISSALMGEFLNKMTIGMEIRSFVFDDGKITMTFLSTNVLDAEKYVRSLRESGMFKEVLYDGYESTTYSDKVSSEDSIEVTKYVFEVHCVVKGGANNEL